MISTLVTEDNLAVNFPRLMRSINNPGLIVLFANPGLGTVVSVGHGEEIHTVADISDGWDSESFTLFEGELSLCNEADLDDEGNDSDDGFGEAIQFSDSQCREEGCEECQDTSPIVAGTIHGAPFTASIDVLLATLGVKLTGAVHG